MSFNNNKCLTCDNEYHSCFSCELSAEEELPYTYSLCSTCFKKTGGLEVWINYDIMISSLNDQRDVEIKDKVNEFLFIHKRK